MAALMIDSSPVMYSETIEATSSVGKQSVRPESVTRTIGVASTVRVTATLIAHAHESAAAAGERWTMLYGLTSSARPWESERGERARARE